MYHSIALKLTDFFIRQSGEKREDEEILVYGAELLLSSVVNTILVLLIGILMRRPLETVLFLLFFCPIRKYTGGYHSSSYWMCSLVFSTYYIVLCAFSATMPFGVRVITMLLSTILILFLSPVEDVNKPLSERRKLKIMVKARIILVVDLVAFIILNALSLDERLLSYISFAFLTLVLLLIAGRIKNASLERKELRQTQVR